MTGRLAAVAAAVVLAGFYVGVVFAICRWRDVVKARREARAQPSGPVIISGEDYGYPENWCSRCQSWRQHCICSGTSLLAWADCPACVSGDHGREDCDEHAAEFTLEVALLSGASGPLARTCAHSLEDAPWGVLGCSCEEML